MVFADQRPRLRVPGPVEDPHADRQLPEMNVRQLSNDDLVLLFLR